MEAPRRFSFRAVLLLALMAMPAVRAGAVAPVAAAQEAGAAAAGAQKAEDALTAAACLGRAAEEAAQPAVFAWVVVKNVPNYLRPLRAIWRLMTLPVKILSPVDTALDMTEVPGDLWAPFKGTWAIVKATPKLLGPVKALGSVLQSGKIALTGAPEPLAAAGADR